MYEKEVSLVALLRMLAAGYRKSFPCYATAVPSIPGGLKKKPVEERQRKEQAAYEVVM